MVEGNGEIIYCIEVGTCPIRIRPSLVPNEPWLMRSNFWCFQMTKQQFGRKGLRIRSPSHLYALVALDGLRHLLLCVANISELS